VLEIYKQNTNKKIQSYLTKFINTKKKETIERQFTGQIKMEIQSVKIYFINFDIFENLGQEIIKTFEPATHTFCINKATTVRDVYNYALDYWNEDIMESNFRKYDLADIYFNDVAAVFDVPVDHFFSQNKMTVKQSLLYNNF
jgi:hypothetical protein